MSEHPIRALARARGWSLRQLAREADVPQPTLQTMIARGSVPRGRTLLALAKALKCKPEDLLPVE